MTIASYIYLYADFILYCSLSIHIFINNLYHHHLWHLKQKKKLCQIQT